MPRKKVRDGESPAPKKIRTKRPPKEQAQAAPPEPKIEPFFPEAAAAPEPEQPPLDEAPHTGKSSDVESTAAPAESAMSTAMQKLQDALVPPETRRPAIVTDGINVIAERRTQGKDAPHMVLDRLGAVTKALGAQNWYDVRSFDWCLDRLGNRYRFSRFYPSVNVLVDVFDDASVTVRDEVAGKTAAIVERNLWRAKQDLAPLGYLPIIRGAVVPPEAFEAALRGEQVTIADGEAVPA